MKQFFQDALILLLFLILNITFLAKFSFVGFVPNLILIALIFWSFEKYSNRIIFLALTGGIFLDLVSPPLAISRALILVFLVFFADFLLKNYILRKNFSSLIFFSIVASIFYEVALLAIKKIPISWDFHQNIYADYFNFELATIISSQVLINVLIIAIGYLLVQKIRGGKEAMIKF